MNDIPPELRGVSPDPTRTPSMPTWVRLTALLLVVAMVGYAFALVF